MRVLLASAFFFSSEIEFIAWSRLDCRGCFGIGIGGIGIFVPTVGVEGRGVFCHEPGGITGIILVENLRR